MEAFLMPALWIALGFVVLIVGGELLVRGASQLALAMKISPLVVGLTVVAFGTSAPELAVSLQAAFLNQADIAVGNVVGSNIVNVLFILGLSAAVAPLLVTRQLIRVDTPLMVFASVLVWGLGFDGKISRIEGAVMFFMLVIYIVWLIRQSRKEQKAVQAEFPEVFAPARAESLKRLGINLALIMVGLVLLALGARWLVDGSVSIARTLGVSELIIGLTIVAVGTSLPECATSILASIRGERDIAVGNVVGSNIFNIFCVLGLSSVFSPSGMVMISNTALQFDIPVMIAVAVACLPVFITGQEITRWEGGLFVTYYGLYVAYLILAATSSTATASFGNLILFGAIPITLVILIVSFIQSCRKEVVRT
jgi:cation:H+ antiporter